MPELPEVQTVINYLKKNILNIKILEIKIKNIKFLKNSTYDEFKKIIINYEFVDIFRIGKYLIFCISNNWFLVVHLRMEGKFFVDKKIIDRKHDYIIFKLKNHSYLSYNDSRQFGTFHITKNLNDLKEIKKVSIDPLDDKFNIDYFYPIVNKSKKNIKAILLDQKLVSGIGNIYASEILFESKVSPFKKGNQLSKEEIERIIISSKNILKEAIKYNGTTIHSFSFDNDKKGNFVNFLKVVGREKKDCYYCNEKILREKQQSRSTFYCPKCQIN